MGTVKRIKRSSGWIGPAIGLSVVVGLAGCAGPGSGLKKSEEGQTHQQISTRMFREGLEAYQKGRLRDAIESWNQVLLLYPEDALAHQYIGKAIQERDHKVVVAMREIEELVVKGQYRPALGLCEEVEDLVPGHKEAAKKRQDLQNELRLLYGKGVLQFQQGNAVEAIQAWEDLLKKDPTYAGAREDLEKAKTIVKAKAQQNDLVKQYAQEAAGAYRLGHVKEAVVAWKKILELSPQHAEARERVDQLVKEKWEQGQEHFKLNRFEKAIVIWQEALEIDPTNLEVSQSIVRAQQMFEERVNKAFQEGIRLYNRGNYLTAIQRWRQALEVDPAHEEMREYTVKATLAQGIQFYREEKLGDAIAMWEQTLKLSPEDPKAALYMRRAKAKQKSLKELGGR